MTRELQLAPAPWCRGIGNDCHKVFDAQGRVVADRTGFDDGHLIAAAPDLLAAAKLMVALVDGSSHAQVMVAIGRLKAAIEKAKGVSSL